MSSTLSAPFTLPHRTPAAAQAMLRLLRHLQHGTLELQLPDGSHLRVAKNNSEHVLTLFLRFGPTDDRQEILMPGVSKTYKADLIAVEASPQPLSKGDLAKRCIFEYRRADNAGNQVGLPSNSLGVESVTMRPGERVLFDTNWANEKKKGIT